MSNTFLENILDVTRLRVKNRLDASDRVQLKNNALTARASMEAYRLRKVLARKDRINIIAEIKKASPSKGILNEKIDIARTAKQYEAGGACAISVLTEQDFFCGSLDDLRTVRKTVNVPILRKDFIIDEFQIYEAAAAGADAILLIVAALSLGNLKDFFRLAQDDLGMDALVEVHTRDEMETAIKVGANIIGVNNRNLRTFEVSLENSRELIKQKPDSTYMISESGLTSFSEISELCNLGFNGFLIGETIMRSDVPKHELQKLMNA